MRNIGSHSQTHTDCGLQQHSPRWVAPGCYREGHGRGSQIQQLFERCLHVLGPFDWTRPDHYGLLCTLKICCIPARCAFSKRYRKLSKVAGMDRFGVAFGRLVREKRGIEGMSQDDLAQKSGLTKARISDIETGKIANPQAKTVDALCVALNISREERAGCHSARASDLPSRLLEKLALHFGRDMPDATEEELEAFLMAKAEEFREMQARLEKLAETEGRISELIRAANAALGEGDFDLADGLLKEAEEVQLQSSTIVALKKQAELRIERGNAALVGGDVAVAAGHFERSSHYFSGVLPEMEADNRHECANLLRYYGYRYKSPAALFEAQEALQRNLGIWKQDAHKEKWCQTKNALGGVSWRLSQFDLPENAMSHLTSAKDHYEDVRACCSEEFLPNAFATAGLDLANVYSDRRLAKSDADYEVNLQFALSLQLSALRCFSKTRDPRAWGIVQHNLGCAYLALSGVRTEEAKSVADIENAIHHAERSFEVRNPDDSLQYWVASCRTLGEALLKMSSYMTVTDASKYIQRASKVLQGAAARISPHEHPHQWSEIQEQLARCREEAPAKRDAD
ncbi:helix-turn-helix domain-containing protein [Bradyrhizobium sp. KB893862 SZCCT0404]|uniref:helix-turn-helix domain-containing protein n=1 Tax=Bradyrhizobium sp. KB893862 SZCCT0404 TaxID=2807672 RepID=UPI001BABAEA0|nr:helix-turn-helix transcriptional regulator [Bradyrhizobium sp. KB893862 SZCCT0404]MBR1177074.1 helix-turn-helix domain-containing protein [Bradyrhizobium sp. KB893862 SZCCT0404]